MKLITRAKSLSKPPVCILMTAYGSEDVAVDAMKQGADDYISKGRLQIDELEMRIARALRQQQPRSRKTSPSTNSWTKSSDWKTSSGDSPAMQRVFDVVRQVAPTRVTVLMHGRERHGQGTDRAGDSSAQPAGAASDGGGAPGRACRPTLVESELFGHEKGAFTGAHERRIGRIEQAQGGTLVPGRDRGDRRHDPGEAAAVSGRTDLRAGGLEQNADLGRAPDRGHEQEPGGDGEGGDVPGGSVLPVARGGDLAAAVAGTGDGYSAPGARVFKGICARNMEKR